MHEMKALIFANGDVNDGAMLRRALEVAPQALIIAADGGAQTALFFGLRPHVIIGDMDSISVATAEAIPDAEIIRFPETKDETDLELALTLAAERGALWIRIIGALGGRLDQLISNVYLLALPALTGRDVRIVAGNQEAWLAHPGTTRIHGAPDDTVSLIPLSGVVRGIRTEHLRYPLNGEDLYFGPARGVSNQLESDMATVHFGGGALLIVHTLGKA